MTDDTAQPVTEGESTDSTGKSVQTDAPAESSDSSKSTKSDDDIEMVTGSLCEIKSLVEKTKAGENTVIEKEKYDSSLEKKPFEQYAIVTKRVLDEDGKLKKTMVTINSPQLLKALKELVQFFPSESLDFDTQVSYDSPYTLLHHHRAELLAYKKASDDETTREHIDLLLLFLASEASDKGRVATKLIASGLITFENSWMVYKPGDLVYASSYGQDRLYTLNQTGYHKDNCVGKYFQLSCSFSACDGEKSGVSQTTLRIVEREEFVGMTPSKITSLSAFPLKFLDAEEQAIIKEKLTARGERYLQIKGVKPYEYNGLFLYLKRPPWDFYDERANVSQPFVWTCMMQSKLTTSTVRWYLASTHSYRAHRDRCKDLR